MIEYDFCEFMGRYTTAQTEVEKFVRLVGVDMFKKEGPWLVGGSLRRTVAFEERLRDFDVQGPTKECLAPLNERFAQRGFACEPRGEKTFVWTKPSESWRVDMSRNFNYPSIEAAFAEFPFTICQFALYCDGPTLKLCCTENAIPDLLHRVLVPVKTKTMTAARWQSRLEKYEAQGFRITSRTVKDMAAILKDAT